jgi:hypothetical protein
MATDASRYGQQPARGVAVTITSGIPTAMPPTPISAKASVWSLMPCAMAFQTAWVTAAARTARVTAAERVVDGSNGAPQAGAIRSPQGFYPVRCSPVLREPAGQVAAPLGPDPAVLIVGVT